MSSTKKYYDKMRNERGSFTIVITKIVDGICEKLPLMIFKDTEVFNEIADNVGNFFSWSAIHIKKYLKDRGVSDTVFCEWYMYSDNEDDNKKRYAHIVLGCGSDGQFSDGTLYQ